jgi:hypothetical protein
MVWLSQLGFVVLDIRAELDEVQGTGEMGCSVCFGAGAVMLWPLHALFSLCSDRDRPDPRRKVVTRIQPLMW